MGEVVLKNLEPVLRNQLGDELIVEDFSQESLLPPGENYGSTILSVVATVKKNKNSKSETIHLVAKMLPPTLFQRENFDSSFTFRKEIFLYETILPCYKKLELDFGVEEKDVFNIGPQFFGSRLSSKEEVDIDEDAVILLENLKVRGYYTGDRKIGLDLEHAKVAIRALAKFHALGMAVKYKRPDQFKSLKVHCKCLKINPEAFEGLNDMLIKAMCSDPVINKYKSKWEPIMHMQPDNWTGTPEEPWSTIIHSDFWVNNIMFHKNLSGKVDDILFVDFQNYLFQNPINDLIFFIAANVITDLLPTNLDSLLDLYYENFISVLKRMDCDISIFGKDAFDKKVKSGSHTEFHHCAFMLKILTLDIEKDGVDTNKLQSMEFNVTNELFFDRLRKLILLFLEREWM